MPLLSSSVVAALQHRECRAAVQIRQRDCDEPWVVTASGAHADPEDQGQSAFCRLRPRLAGQAVPSHRLVSLTWDAQNGRGGEGEVEHGGPLVKRLLTVELQLLRLVRIGRCHVRRPVGSGHHVLQRLKLTAGGRPHRESSPARTGSG